MRRKLAIVTTHPIQYNAPWFRLLAARKKVEIKVFYTWSQASEGVDDVGFGKVIKWDIDLLDGYDYTFVKNISKNPGSKSWSGIDNPELIDTIKIWKPDALLIFGWKFKSHFKVMRFFLKKIPVYFRGDSTLLDEILWFQSVSRRLVLTLVYSYINKAFYVGANNKAYFLSNGLKKAQLQFVPHAIDNNRFFDDDSKRLEERANSWRAQLKYQEEDIVLLFAGKFELKKAPIFLLKCLIDFNRNKTKKLKLLYIGNGQLEQELKKLALPYKETVQFLPFQNQSLMPIIYRLGDILVLPSIGPGETWGLAVNEAMACNRPVIVSDKVGCQVDLVINHQTGWSFQANNKAALNLVFKQVLELPKEQLLIMGMNAKQLIQSWNFESICEQIERNI